MPKKKVESKKKSQVKNPAVKKPDIKRKAVPKREKMDDKEFLKLLKQYKKASKSLYSIRSGAVSESSEREGYKTKFDEVLKLFKQIEEEFILRCMEKDEKDLKMPMKEDGQLNIRAVRKKCL